MGFILKGRGWYADGYTSESRKEHQTAQQAKSDASTDAAGSKQAKDGSKETSKPEQPKVQGKGAEASRKSAAA
jgi:hypothetical protein